MQWGVARFAAVGQRIDHLHHGDGAGGAEQDGRKAQQIVTQSTPQLPGLMQALVLRHDPSEAAWSVEDEQGEEQTEIEGPRLGDRRDRDPHDSDERGADDGPAEMADASDEGQLSIHHDRLLVMAMERMLARIGLAADARPPGQRFDCLADLAPEG